MTEEAEQIPGIAGTFEHVAKMGRISDPLGPSRMASPSTLLPVRIRPVVIKKNSREVIPSQEIPVASTSSDHNTTENHKDEEIPPVKLRTKVLPDNMKPPSRDLESDNGTLTDHTDKERERNKERYREAQKPKENEGKENKGIRRRRKSRRKSRAEGKGSKENDMEKKEDKVRRKSSAASDGEAARPGRSMRAQPRRLSVGTDPGERLVTPSIMKDQKLLDELMREHQKQDRRLEMRDVARQLINEAFNEPSKRDGGSENPSEHRPDSALSGTVNTSSSRPSALDRLYNDGALNSRTYSRQGTQQTDSSVVSTPRRSKSEDSKQRRKSSRNHVDKDLLLKVIKQELKYLQAHPV